MGALNKTVFAGITYGVMGMGTEGGATPYRITVAADGGWGGAPIKQSGYSIGAMQFDFGQRGKNIDSKTGKSYSESFVNAVNEWARENNNPQLSSRVVADLSTKGSTIKWLSDADRAIISAFGDTAAGKGWVNNHLEKGLISEYEAKITPVLNGTAFDGWSEGDILVATAVLTKAANQSPNRGFAALSDLTKKDHADGYTLDDFLVDIYSVPKPTSKAWPHSTAIRTTCWTAGTKNGMNSAPGTTKTVMVLATPASSAVWTKSASCRSSCKATNSSGSRRKALPK